MATGTDGKRGASGALRRVRPALGTLSAILCVICMQGCAAQLQGLAALANEYAGSTGSGSGIGASGFATATPPQQQPVSFSSTADLSGRKFAIVPAFDQGLLAAFAEVCAEVGYSNADLDAATGNASANSTKQYDISEHLAAEVANQLAAQGGTVLWQAPRLGSKEDVRPVFAEARRRGCTDVVFLREPHANLSKSMAGNAYRDAGAVSVRVDASVNLVHAAILPTAESLKVETTVAASAQTIRCPGCKRDLERQAQKASGFGAALLSATASLSERFDQSAVSDRDLTMNAIREMSADITGKVE